MRYYIATKLENHEQHNEVRDVLHNLGHKITYDWTTHGSVQNSTPHVIQEVAKNEAQGVLDAGLTILLLPKGMYSGRGTHAELGIAIGANKQVIIWSDEPDLFAMTGKTCAFYHHPNVTKIFGGDPIPQIVGLIRNMFV